jgi:YihY family inner membrane protein
VLVERLKRVPALVKLKLETWRAKNAPLDIGMQMFKEFSLDDGGTHVAAMTYYTFFSIFPMMLFGAAILGYVTQGNEKLRDDLMNAALDSFPLLRDIFSPAGLEFIEKRRQELAITGVVLALYTGTGAIVAMEHALNRIGGVTEEANWLAKRVAAVKWLVVFGVGAVLSIALGGAAGWATGIFDGSASAVTGWTLGHVTGMIVGVFLFAAAYRFLQNKSVSWREVLPGAVLAAFLFELLKEFGSWYLERGAEGREAAFGVFASAAGLLVASFLLCQIILLAAEFNDVLAQRRVTRQSLQQEAKEAQDV